MQGRAEGWRRVLSDERRVGRDDGRPAATLALIFTARAARRWDMAGLGPVGKRGVQLCLQIRLAVVAVAWLPSVAFGRQRRSPSDHVDSTFTEPSRTSSTSTEPNLRLLVAADCPTWVVSDMIFACVLSERAGQPVGLNQWASAAEADRQRR